MTDPRREQRISKTLSWVLRHGAPKLGLTLLPGGYVPVSEVLALPEVRKEGVTQQEIEQIVMSNAKKRFALKKEGWKYLICATQGHSFKVESPDLKPILLEEVAAGKYPVVLHGTYFKAWQIIKKEGLRRMTRTHVHMAKGTFGEVTSGVRQSVQILIYIDLEKALQDGLKFWESMNGVVLCEGPILPKYFKSVVKAKNGEPFDPDFP